MSEDLAAFLNARVDEKGRFAAIARLNARTRAQILREAQALKTIVTIYTEQDGRELPPGVHDGRDPDERECDQALQDAFGDILRILGEVYSDRPDYRQEWRWSTASCEKSR